MKSPTRRLSAIREYTEFGSGFQIAMRDLEIRGAGNILGAQQHGHMEAVGYDMYIQMLSEAIAEERGEKPQKPEEECLIDLQVEAHIPEEYIESIPQRLSIYRRIADIRTPDDVEDVYDELIDRFGDPSAQLCRGWLMSPSCATPPLAGASTKSAQPRQLPAALF